jgi:hypothetical protein
LATYKKLGWPKQIIIAPDLVKGRLRFTLKFREGSTPQIADFEMTAADAMKLLVALKGLQAQHRIPIPESVRPKRGTPTLAVVTDKP